MLRINGLWELVMLSIRSPREGGEALLAQSLPRGTLWSVLALCAIVSTLLSWVSAFLTGVADAFAISFMERPVQGAIVQFIFGAILAGSIHSIGRTFGGRGAFDESLQVVAWLNVIMVALQVAQLVAYPIFPLFAVFLTFAGVALFFYLLTGFVQAVHGFASAGSVFVMIVLSLFAVLMVLSVILTSFGIAPLAMPQ